MADAPRSNFLAIFLGISVGISLVGIAGMLVVGWVLNRSFESLLDRMLSDTGAWEVPEEGEWEGEEFEVEDFALEDAEEE